jgi:pimeloyl-ACP methyl ester carboxylesterase
MSTGFFRTDDGCVLAYEDTGSGMPIVWQHGLGADRQQPAEVFPESDNVRRITLECRGHGESELGDPGRISIAQFGSDVIALLDHLGIDQALLGGISLGAAISLPLAVKFRLRFTGLIIARPAWIQDAAPSTMRPYLVVAELLRDFGREEGLRRFSTSEVYAEVADVSPDNAVSLCSFFSRANGQSTIELLSRIPKDGPGVTLQDIASLDLPTLVIGNGEEYVHPLAYASQLSDLIPNAKLHIVTSKTVDNVLYRSQFREALAAFIGERAVAV